MIELVALILIFWAPIFLVFIKNFFWDLYFWQIKEYRFDRFWTHVLWDQDDQNRNIYLLIAKFLIFSLLTFLFYLPALAIAGMLVVYTLWVYEAFDFGKDLLNKKTRKPALKSIRNILVLILIFGIIIMSISLISAPFFEITRSSGTNYINDYIGSLTDVNEDYIFPDIYVLLGLFTLLALFIDLASPLILPPFVFATHIFTYIKRESTIKKARAKFQSLKHNLIVIGITGSQGKTTTKELLYEILKDDFKVAKTPENYNTSFGVADSILKYLNIDTEVFIAEMGAYKKGEIQKIVNNFEPNISIITDIDTQHLGLFGSREKLAEAKSEIISGNPSAVNILNGDNEYCRNFAKLINGKKVYVSSDKSNFKEVESLNGIKTEIYLATKIKDSKETISFEIDDKDNKTKVKFNGSGRHIVDLLMLCFAVGNELGLSKEKIAGRIKEIKIKLPRLGLDYGDNDTFILNDTYNSSFKGFIAATNLMDTIKHENNLNKRIVLTKGIYELGREKRNIYHQLLNKVKDQIDILITSDHLLANTAKKDNLHMQIIKVKNYEEMLYEYRKAVNPKDIILLEGKLNPSLIKEIISDKF